MGDGGHAGQARDALTRLAEEGHALLLVVTLEAEVEGDAEQVLRLEAGIGLARGLQAAQEEAGADEGHQRQRDLAHDQDVADAEAASHAAPGAIAVLERIDHVRLAGLQGGHEAEEDPRAHAHRHREGEHPPIEIEMQGDGDARQRRQQRQQTAARPVSDGDPQGGRRQGEGHALGEELADEPPPAGADGQAYGDLAPAMERAAEEQVRDVGAGDEQDEADDGHQQRRHRHHAVARVRVHGGARQRHHGHAAALVVVRVFRLEPLGDHAEAGLGLRRGDPGLQPALGEHEQPAALFVPVDAGLDLLVHGHRHPHLGADADVEARVARRGDADDRVRRAVEVQRLAHRARIRAEALRPEGMAQHHDRIAPRDLVLVGTEGPADHGAHAQQVEVVSRDELAEEDLGLAARVEAHGRPVVAEHALEHLAVLGVVLPVEVRKRPEARVLPVGRVDREQAVRFRHGDALQQQGVGHAEDRRIGPDAEAERQDREAREHRALQDHPYRVAKILPQRFHESPPHLFVDRLGREPPVDLARMIVGLPRGFALGFADLRTLLRPALIDRGQAPARAASRGPDGLPAHRHEHRVAV